MRIFQGAQPWKPQTPGLYQRVRALVQSSGGFMLDPTNLSTLAQNSAGSTPVTADEQPVGRIIDVSGNGHHFTQSTNGLRPIVDTIGGERGMFFDGIDDFLVGSFTLGAFPVYISARVIDTDYPGEHPIVSIPNSDSARGVFLYNDERVDPPRSEPAIAAINDADDGRYTVWTDTGGYLSGYTLGGAIGVSAMQVRANGAVVETGDPPPSPPITTVGTWLGGWPLGGGPVYVATTVLGRIVCLAREATSAEKALIDAWVTA